MKVRNYFLGICLLAAIAFLPCLSWANSATSNSGSLSSSQATSLSEQMVYTSVTGGSASATIRDVSPIAFISWDNHSQSRVVTPMNIMPVPQGEGTPQYFGSLGDPNADKGILPMFYGDYIKAKGEKTIEFESWWHNITHAYAPVKKVHLLMPGESEKHVVYVGAVSYKGIPGGTNSDDLTDLVVWYAMENGANIVDAVIYSDAKSDSRDASMGIGSGGGGVVGLHGNATIGGSSGFHKGHAQLGILQQRSISARMYRKDGPKSIMIKKLDVKYDSKQLPVVVDPGPAYQSN